jgi:hypothetical protein
MATVERVTYCRKQRSGRSGLPALEPSKTVHAIRPNILSLITPPRRRASAPQRREMKEQPHSLLSAQNDPQSLGPHPRPARALVRSSSGRVRGTASPRGHRPPHLSLGSGNGERRRPPGHCLMDGPIQSGPSRLLCHLARWLRDAGSAVRSGKPHARTRRLRLRPLPPPPHPTCAAQSSEFVNSGAARSAHCSRLCCRHLAGC